jgi:hypothetical protein
MLPLLPKFPCFVKACELILSEEASGTLSPNGPPTLLFMLPVDHNRSLTILYLLSHNKIATTTTPISIMVARVVVMAAVAIAVVAVVMVVAVEAMSTVAATMTTMLLPGLHLPHGDHREGLAGVHLGLGSPALVFLALTHLYLLLRPIRPLNPR